MHGQVPALLLEWRQTPDGWEARVVRPILDFEDGKLWPRALARPPVGGSKSIPASPARTIWAW